MQLGQRVKVRAVLKPVRWRREPTDYHKSRRWDRVEQPFTGYIAGVRVVQEGEMRPRRCGSSSEYDPPEYVEAFEATRYLRVYLVAVSLRQLVRALPEDVEEE